MNLDFIKLIDTQETNPTPQSHGEKPKAIPFQVVLELVKSKVLNSQQTGFHKIAVSRKGTLVVDQTDQGSSEQSSIVKLAQNLQEKIPQQNATSTNSLVIEEKLDNSQSQAKNVEEKANNFIKSADQTNLTKQASPQKVDENPTKMDMQVESNTNQNLDQAVKPVDFLKIEPNSAQLEQGEESQVVQIKEHTAQKEVAITREDLRMKDQTRDNQNLSKVVDQLSVSQTGNDFMSLSTKTVSDKVNPKVQAASFVFQNDQMKESSAQSLTVVPKSNSTDENQRQRATDAIRVKDQKTQPVQIVENAKENLRMANQAKQTTTQAGNNQQPLTQGIAQDLSVSNQNESNREVRGNPTLDRTQIQKPLLTRNAISNQPAASVKDNATASEKLKQAVEDSKVELISFDGKEQAILPASVLRTGEGTKAVKFGRQIENKINESLVAEKPIITIKQVQVIFDNIVKNLEEYKSEFSQYRNLKKELPQNLKFSEPIKIENLKLEIARDLKKEKPVVVNEELLKTKLEQTEKTKEIFNAKLGKKAYETDQTTVEIRQLPRNIEAVVTKVEQQQRSENLQAIVETIRQMNNSNVERAFVNLNPPTLGRLEIQIVKQGETLNVVFKVASEEAKELLEKSSKDLVSRLSSVGFKVETVEIRMSEKTQEDEHLHDNREEQQQQHQRHKRWQESEVKEDDKRDQ